MDVYTESGGKQIQWEILLSLLGQPAITKLSGYRGEMLGGGAIYITNSFSGVTLKDVNERRLKRLPRLSAVWGRERTAKASKRHFETTKIQLKLPKRRRLLQGRKKSSHFSIYNPSLTITKMSSGAEVKKGFIMCLIVTKRYHGVNVRQEAGCTCILGAAC